MSLAIGEEQIPTGEDDLIKQLVGLQIGIMKAKTDATHPTRRGQHPKHHGCTDAEFVVHGDIPEAYRIGIFKEPGTYKAKVRWSNGGEDDDMNADVHGMAVKVLGVKGTPALEGNDREEQDFILIDSESFFVPDVQLMLELMTARVRSAKDPKVMADFAEKHRDIAAALGAARKKIPSPLTTRLEHRAVQARWRRREVYGRAVGREQVRRCPGSIPRLPPRRAGLAAGGGRQWRAVRALHHSAGRSRRQSRRESHGAVEVGADPGRHDQGRTAGCSTRLSA